MCCCQEERDAREQMLQEQDAAYKKSLETDRAKVRQCILLHSLCIVLQVKLAYFFIMLRDYYFPRLHCVHEKSNPLDNVR